MSFDPDSITPTHINDLREAAERSWGDDTRHEAYIGHPDPSAGQCLCSCGCGQIPPLATRTRNGNVKGRSVKFCPGHFQRTKMPVLKYKVEDRGFRSPCWIWTGSRNRAQYGTYSGACGGRWMRAYVASYEYYRGPVSLDMELDHLCRQTLCINPNHLEIVTHAENVRRGLSTKLTEQEVRDIRRSSLSQRRLAEIYGVSKTNICYIKQGKTWIDVGPG